MIQDKNFTPAPWVWTTFCKANGDPIQTAQDVADTVAVSALHSVRAELWGVTLAAQAPDDGLTVVCYTGNGPNAHNNARAIAQVPQLVAFLRHLLARDHGFVYSKDEALARTFVRYLDGESVEEAQLPDAVDPVEGIVEG